MGKASPGASYRTETGRVRHLAVGISVALSGSLLAAVLAVDFGVGLAGPRMEESTSCLALASRSMSSMTCCTRSWTRLSDLAAMTWFSNG